MEAKLETKFSLFTLPDFVLNFLEYSLPWLDPIKSLSTKTLCPSPPLATVSTSSGLKHPKQGRRVSRLYSRFRRPFFIALS